MLAGGSLVRSNRSPDFASDRRTMIGGTDIAPILGVSERRTRFAVWASKVRDDYREDSSTEEEAAAGAYYEPFILRRFAERYRVRVLPCNETFRRRAALFLGANPDGFVLAPAGGEILGLVDAKTRSPFQRGLWGAAGTGAVPADELCQMQWYMEILDLPVAWLAVFFDRVLHVFVVVRDRELGTLMVEEATAFWNEYVAPRVEPPFEGPAAADYLRRKYPRVLDPMKDATPEDDILVARRDLIRRHIAALKASLSGVENQLRARIATSSGIAGTGYVARWGEVKAKTKTDWRAVVTELRSFPAVADEAAAAAFRAAIDEAVARHTESGEPTRALKVYFRGPRDLPAVELEPLALPAAAGEEEP